MTVEYGVRLYCDKTGCKRNFVQWSPHGHPSGKDATPTGNWFQTYRRGMYYVACPEHAAELAKWAADDAEWLDKRDKSGRATFSWCERVFSSDAEISAKAKESREAVWKWEKDNPRPPFPWGGA